MIAPKVMVVEDEEPLGVLLRYNLEAEGYQVEIVTRGDEAEVRLQEHVPDLLVLDWMVPGVSGIELCRRLRMRAETERLPIIMLTARGEESDRVRGLSHSIEAMADLVLHQVEAVVARYVARDAEGLLALRADDEKIDIQYTSTFRELLTYMMEDPRNITACTHLLFCAKNLERIGDHVTNIAEKAYYAMTGMQPPQHRPKLDETSLTPAQ